MLPGTNDSEKWPVDDGQRSQKTVFVVGLGMVGIGESASPKRTGIAFTMV
jgi:hypothetical protein